MRIGEDVTEEIDFVPAKLIRRRTVRPKYAYPCGDGGVAIAPLPPRLIPQSRLGLLSKRPSFAGRERAVGGRIQTRSRGFLWNLPPGICQTVSRQTEDFTAFLAQPAAERSILSQG